MKTLRNSLLLFLASLCLACSSAFNFHHPVKEFTYYLPLEPFKNASLWPGSDTSAILHYSKYLSTFEEPTIFRDTNGSEKYRLTLLRSFGEPICIRLEKANGKWYLHSKIIHDKHVGELDELEVFRPIGVLPQGSAGFEEMIIQTDFWNLPALEKKLPDTDGSSWLFEGRRDQEYHFIERQSPDKDDPIFKLGAFLLQISPLEVDIRGI